MIVEPIDRKSDIMGASNLQDHSHQSTLRHGESSSDSSSSSHSPILPAPAEDMDTTDQEDNDADPSSSSHGPIEPPVEEAMDATASNTHAGAVPSEGQLKSSFKNPERPKKRVSWDRIHTREFDLVVGDHPMCQDSLPVSLGWQYNDQSYKHLQTQELLTISERRQSYLFPRRLSYEERRERLISVSNLTSDQIQNDEIDLAVRTLKETWETQYVDGNYISDVVMTPVQTNFDFTSIPLAGEDLMELDEIEVVPGIEGEELGDITNFEWR